jgi:hypothetical protein
VNSRVEPVKTAFCTRFAEGYKRRPDETKSRDSYERELDSYQRRISQRRKLAMDGKTLVLNFIVLRVK